MKVDYKKGRLHACPEKNEEHLTSQEEEVALADISKIELKDEF